MVELDPGSDVAKTVKSHLDALVAASMMPAPERLRWTRRLRRPRIAGRVPRGVPVRERRPVTDLGSVLGIGLAFLGGLASFASPCCLPLVPAYIELHGRRDR